MIWSNVLGYYNYVNKKTISKGEITYFRTLIKIAEDIYLIVADGSGAPKYGLHIHDYIVRYSNGANELIKLLEEKIASSIDRRLVIENIKELTIEANYHFYSKFNQIADTANKIDSISLELYENKIYGSSVKDTIANNVSNIKNVIKELVDKLPTKLIGINDKIANILSRNLASIYAKGNTLVGVSAKSKDAIAYSIGSDGVITIVDIASVSGLSIAIPTTWVASGIVFFVMPAEYFPQKLQDIGFGVQTAGEEQQYVNIDVPLFLDKRSEVPLGTLIKISKSSELYTTYYTLDGSIPSIYSNEGNEIYITSDVKIRAINVCKYYQSMIASKEYKIAKYFEVSTLRQGTKLYQLIDNINAYIEVPNELNKFYIIIRDKYSNRIVSSLTELNRDQFLINIQSALNNLNGNEILLVTACDSSIPLNWNYYQNIRIGINANSLNFGELVLYYHPIELKNYNALRVDNLFR